MAQDVPGLLEGIVTDVSDPTGTGRIKVRYPGLEDYMTAYWVMPMGWAGAGGQGQGAHPKPPPVGSEVVVMYAFGDYQHPKARAYFLTGWPGLREVGGGYGAAIVYEGASADAARNRASLYESDTFRVGLIEETATKKLIIQDKKRGTKIEINAADGDGGSSTLRIEAVSGMSIYAKGPITIESDTQVNIQGRVVSDLSDADI